MQYESLQKDTSYKPLICKIYTLHFEIRWVCGRVGSKEGPSLTLKEKAESEPVPNVLKQCEEQTW